MRNLIRALLRALSGSRSAAPTRESSAAATPASRRSLLDHGQHPKRRVEINALSLQSRQRNDLRTPRAGPNCSLAR